MKLSPCHETVGIANSGLMCHVKLKTWQRVTTQFLFFLLWAESTLLALFALEWNLLTIY